MFLPDELANARIVRLYYPYQQYTNLFIFVMADRVVQWLYSCQMSETAIHLVLAHLYYR